MPSSQKLPNLGGFNQIVRLRQRGVTHSPHLSAICGRDVPSSLPFSDLSLLMVLCGNQRD
jgi:hypothetical protein